MANTKLNQTQLNIIIGLISGWTDKLTWERLVKRIQDVTGVEVTRQALDRYCIVKETYQKRKAELRQQHVSIPEGRQLRHDALSKQIVSLEAQLRVREKQIATLQGFIADLVDEAKEIPSLLEVFRQVKHHRMRGE
ncbi:TPA: hypothetical protein ACGTRQ_003816 [Vibrio parahaemolyticus]